jgi:hypothetical protein
MVQVHSFRGWRYDVAQVGDLSDVTCPPYDVIDGAFQERLYEQHPCNVVRLELNRDEPGDATPDEKKFKEGLGPDPASQDTASCLLNPEQQ